MQETSLSAHDMLLSTMTQVEPHKSKAKAPRNALIEEHLKSGRLETVLNSYVATSTGYYLYYPQRSQVQPKLRVFIEYLKQARK